MNKCFLTSLLCALTLAGCTSISPNASYNNQYSGKFSVREPSGHHTGTYRLESSGDHFLLTLLGPMGIALAKIESSPDLTKISITGQETIETTDTAALFERELGVALPLQALQSWLEGKPSPAIEYQQLSDQEFTQCGLTVTIVRTDNNGMPTLIRIASKQRNAQLTLTVLREAKAL